MASPLPLEPICLALVFPYRRVISLLEILQPDEAYWKSILRGIDVEKRSHANIQEKLLAQRDLSMKGPILLLVVQDDL